MAQCGCFSNRSSALARAKADKFSGRIRESLRWEVIFDVSVTKNKVGRRNGAVIKMERVKYKNCMTAERLKIRSQIKISWILTSQ